MGRSDQRAAEVSDGVSYRAECARKADAFEQFNCDGFISTGRTCTRHIGMNAQLRFGDLRINGRDAELKFDQLHHETGNYYIEVAERRSAARAWVNSGIYASSAAHWYIVGDYTHVLVFERAVLRSLAGDHRIIEIERRTSKGFLLERAEALRTMKYIQPWRGRTWNGTTRSIE